MLFYLGVEIYTLSINKHFVSLIGDIMDFSGLTDHGILQELGQRIARQRLNANVKQAELAYEAGVSRKTLSNLENGHSVQLDSLIRILRALNKLDQLSLLLPTPEVSPIALADLKGKQRQRASKPTALLEAQKHQEDGEDTWHWPA